MSIEIVDVHEVLRREHRLEFIFHKLGVIRADPESHDRADVAEDRVADFIGKLFDELVGNEEIQAVFASFGQDRGDAIGGEILELIDVEIEVFAGVIGNVHPRKGGHKQFANDDHAQKIRIDVPNAAFGQIDDQNFLIIHQLAEVKRALLLVDDRAEEFVKYEGGHLGRNIRGHIGQTGAPPPPLFL